MAAAAASSWGIQQHYTLDDHKARTGKAIPDCSCSSREGSLESEICFSSPLQEDRDRYHHESASSMPEAGSSNRLASFGGSSSSPVNLLSDQEWISFLRWRSWQMIDTSPPPSTDFSQLDYAANLDPTSSLPLNCPSSLYDEQSLAQQLHPSLPNFDPAAAAAAAAMPAFSHSLYDSGYEDPFLAAFASSTLHQGLDLSGRIKPDNVDHSYNAQAFMTSNYPGIVASSSPDQGKTRSQPIASSSTESVNRSSLENSHSHIHKSKKRPLDHHDSSRANNSGRNNKKKSGSSDTSSLWAIAAAAAAASEQQPPIIHIADSDRTTPQDQQLILEQISCFNAAAAASSTSSGSKGGRVPALNTNLKPRARQGSANDPQSIAARHRRERISDRLKILQELVPNSTKVDLVTMLEKAINYVKFLQLQVKVLTSDEYWPAGKADAAL